MISKTSSSVLAVLAMLSAMSCGTGVIVRTSASESVNNSGSNGNGGGTGGSSDGSGGTTGMGGEGGGGIVDGTGGMPPPKMVGNCNGLGGIDEFQDITPPQVNRAREYGILAVVADQVNTGTIYAGTGKQGLWKSVDCGSTWRKANTGRNGDLLDSGMQWELQIDPTDPNVLYAGSLYGKDNSLFKSTDAGTSWNSVFPAGSEVANTVEYNFFQEMSMDPTNSRHIVVSFHANCKGQFGPMCMGESLNGGATWRLFKGPTPGWSENARPLVLGPTTWLYATWADGLFFTNNSGASWERIGAGGGRMHRPEGGPWYLGNHQGIHRGSADGRTWTRINGSPPSGTIISDGQRLFASYYFCCADKQPFNTAPQATGEGWTKLASPRLDHGAALLARDPDHNLIFAATATGGLWRFRSR